MDTIDSDDNRDAVKKLVRYWEHLTPADLPRIGEVYAENATFQDPFNKVQGHEALKHIFGDMFVRLNDPRFVILETLIEDNRVMLVWDFTFHIKSLKPELKRTIHGASLVRLGADGRVVSHRDYWDAAGELYEQLPLVGALMRWLKARMA